MIGNDFEHSYELCVIRVCHHDSSSGTDISKLKSAEAHAGPRGRPSLSFLRKKLKNKTEIFFKLIKKNSEPMLFIFISTFQNLYIFEQNSSFVLPNVPIVKSTKVCYEQLEAHVMKHIYI